MLRRCLSDNDISRAGVLFYTDRTAPAAHHQQLNRRREAIARFSNSKFLWSGTPEGAAEGVSARGLRVVDNHRRDCPVRPLAGAIRCLASSSRIAKASIGSHVICSSKRDRAARRRICENLAMAQAFKVGDNVRLKSGGPRMTLRSVDDRGYVRTTWSSGAEKEHGHFHLDALIGAFAEPTATTATDRRTNIGGRNESSISSLGR
jgi:uncharacterized protein YodC (DUF2158 family)